MSLSVSTGGRRESRRPGSKARNWDRSNSIRLWPSRNSPTLEKSSSLANAPSRPSVSEGKVRDHPVSGCTPAKAGIRPSMTPTSRFKEIHRDRGHLLSSPTAGTPTVGPRHDQRLLGARDRRLEQVPDGRLRLVDRVPNQPQLGAPSCELGDTGGPQFFEVEVSSVRGAVIPFGEEDRPKIGLNLGRPGVYVLVRLLLPGVDMPRLNIGVSDHALRRLVEHRCERPWERAIVLTSNQSAMTRNHFRHIEGV